MKFDRLKVRRWMLVLLTVGAFGVFAARLMSIQVVRADELRNQLEVGSTSRQTVKATRGEIVDRNGVSLVSNKPGYDVVIDKVSLPRNTQNDILLRLIQLFEESGETWNDNLPITTGQPFEFLTGYDSAETRLKEFLEIQAYSSAEEAMYWLRERYKLQEYSARDARKIAAVRYEMDQRGFAINVPYTFASDVGIDLVLKIKELSYQQLSGVEVQESAIRSYDLGTIAPHIIGRVGPIYQEQWANYKEKGYAMDDIVGKEGVERYFEEELRGQNGVRIIELDNNGRVLGVNEVTPPQAGNTVMLTIDVEMQGLLQDALEAQIKWLQANALPGEGRESDHGAAVVINVKTGELLAAATYPSYDLNTFSQSYTELANNEHEPLLNRALQGLYAPGSIFKPAVATAALARGVITATDTVSCARIYTRFSDYQPRCLSAHGPIALTRALAESCNIFFYDVGWNLGIEGIDRVAMQYGLGEPTGIELYEEIGRRSNPETAEAASGEKWSNGNVLQTAIGQLVAWYTPLQMGNYAATIANRGERMKITIVKEILDYSRNEVIQPSQPVVLDRVDARPSDFEDVVTGMIATSRVGSARAHFSAYPFDVASKTGTPEAQMLNSTFICFAPAQEPELAMAVVIENGYHGYTSAPVARAIFDDYFGVPNANPLVKRELPIELPDDSARVQEASGLSQREGEPQGESQVQEMAEPADEGPVQPAPSGEQSGNAAPQDENDAQNMPEQDE